MTKPTFTTRGRPNKSTSFSHNKNAKTYGKTNTQRGRVRLIVRASIQT